jgi:DNA-binding helix-hairpin-helix protein with protein kinase domain
VPSCRVSWQQQLLLEAERDTGLVMPRVRGSLPSHRDVMQELRQKQQELRMAPV